MGEQAHSKNNRTFGEVAESRPRQAEMQAELGACEIEESTKLDRVRRNSIGGQANMTNK